MPRPGASQRGLAASWTRLAVPGWGQVRARCPSQEGSTSPYEQKPKGSRPFAPKAWHSAHPPCPQLYALQVTYSTALQKAHKLP